MSPSHVDLLTDPASHPEGSELLGQLLHSLERSRHLANFACGGSIPIAESDGSASYPRLPVPVVIRWDHPARPAEDASTPTFIGEKVVFSAEMQETAALSTLVRDCQPATFGRGQQDILDESYRKAGKLDPTQFSTNFCPYETGIIDAVTTVLLNETVGVDDQVSLGVWAELYKLNVYSGPSGKFKAHVDTPRSDKQFGSLVVCLPYPHSGGSLQVRHEGQVVDFDWSTGSVQPGNIHWAAFYSDCEHEVMEVESGHRITLTYNLYHKTLPTSSSSVPLPINDKQTPFYDMMRKLMQLPTFLEEGGLLGIYCSHTYPHTNRSEYKKIPHVLKGADAAIYRSLRELPGVSVRLLPVLGKGVSCDILFDYEQSLLEKDLQSGERTHPVFDGSVEKLRKKVFPISAEGKDSEAYEEYPEEDVAETWGEYWQRMGEPDESRYKESLRHRDRWTVKSHINLAGAELQPLKTPDMWPCETLKQFEESFDKAFPLQLLRDVQWLNKQHSEELSMIYLAYGNEASTGFVYSSLSFIVSIPPYRERQ